MSEPWAQLRFFKVALYKFSHYYYYNGHGHSVDDDDGDNDDDDESTYDDRIMRSSPWVSKTL